MPSLFTKGLARRRSSGNALEDITTPTEGGSSFKVLDRSEVNRQSAEPKGFAKISGSRPFSSERQQSYDGGAGSNRYGGPVDWLKQDNTQRNSRGSDGSSGKNSVNYDTDPETNDDSYRRPTTSKKNSKDGGFSIRNVRTFTFGGKKDTGSPNSRPEAYPQEEPSLSDSPPRMRERAMTTSSYASTAVPPKIESKLDVGGSDFGSGLGDLFSGFGKRRSRNLDDVPMLPPQPAVIRSESEPSFAEPSKRITPNPIRVDRAKDIESSPYSWDSSRGSQDGLMPSPGENGFATGSKLTTPFSKSYQPLPVGRSGSPLSFMRNNGSPDLQRPDVPRHQKSFDSRPGYDADAEFVRSSARASRDMISETSSPASYRKPATGTTSASGDSYTTKSTSSRESAGQDEPTLRDLGKAQTAPVGLFDNTNLHPASAQTTPRQSHLRPAVEDNEPLFDNRTAASIRGAMTFADKPVAPQKMSAAEYERMQKQQSSAGAEEYEDEEENYDEADDDEDEQQRHLEAERLRRKQAADLAVHRQKMQKVTGGSSMAPLHNSRPSVERNGYSSPNLGAADNDASDNSDEDVPLGQLMAHGFPKANRPPSQLKGASSMLGFAPGGVLGPGQRPATASPAGPSGAARPGVPEFARGLPVDPFDGYFGASLVGPSDRSAFGLGKGTPSVYGGSVAGGPPRQSASVPVGGLVGIIDAEEKAKTARRASPSSQFVGFGEARPLPSNMPQQMPQMGMMPGMGMQMGGQMPHMQTPGMDPGMSQMQMQQMQMMQLMQQMQQQMQAMQMGQPQMQQGMSPNGFLAPPNGTRPMSMASNGPGMGQRTMSMISMPTFQPPTSNYAPSVHNLGIPGQGYAPSIAPSERSNVGQPGRYRPVTLQVPDGASTAASSNTLQAEPVSNGKVKGRLVDKFSKGRRTKTDGAGDEEDEGWFGAKDKKSRWRKGASTTEQHLPNYDLGDA